MDPKTDVGPLFVRKCRSKQLDDQVQKTIEAGATVILGGGDQIVKEAFFKIQPS